MDKYQYEPLPSNGKHIRLVVLHPRVASRPDDIRITIANTPLEAGQRLWPSFMALSYVWGDTNNRRDIKVIKSADDSDSEDVISAKRISVTANLAEALKYLPYADSHIILWIDALCINQDDLEERAQQVKLMAEIYSSAERVLAWVGPSSHNSNVALNMFHRIADSIDVDVDSPSLEIRRKESKWTKESDTAAMYFQLLLDPQFPLPWDGPETQSFGAFFDRSWFGRLWVRQEITLGAKDALILCGSSSMEWAKFKKAAIFLSKKAKDVNNPRFQQYSDRMSLMADTVSHRGAARLGPLLRQMQCTECADPRDRVYGIMGILPAVSQGLVEKIQPDYTKPVVQVYKELVLAEMEVTCRADLLSECRLADSTSPDWRPSWVPNWTVRRQRHLVMSDQFADGQSTVAACVEGDSLRIKGVCAATVVDVVPIVIQDAAAATSPVPPVVTLIKGLATKLDLSEEARYQPSQGNSVLEALCYVFAGGSSHVAEHLSDERMTVGTPSIAQFMRFVKFALAFDIDDASTRELSQELRSDILLCMGVLAQACQERSLVIMEGGYIGMGPVLAQPGDQIAVILGCTAPLVLRSSHISNPGVSGNDDTFTVVGPCDVFGLDWGQALLGPLPEGMRLIWSPSAPNGDASPAFRNKTTGEDALLDPRIDWDLLRVEGKEYSFVKAASTTGAAGDVTMYKRPDAAYFENKGIKLRDFHLV